MRDTLPIVVAPRFPLGDALGMTIEVEGPGRSRTALDLSPSLLNPHGAIHGAVLFALVDTGMGAATMSVLEPNELCATIELHLRFLKPTRQGRLVADSTVVHKGRRVVQLESKVVANDGTLVATATASFAVFIKAM
jgi:acyl-CoA thioesterase